jgi:hypothetical protein
MVNNSLVWVRTKTKKELDSAKLCPDESYNSVIIRSLKALNQSK